MEIAAPQLLRESAASADPVRMTRDEEIADASFRAADFASLDREHLSVQGCLFTGCLFAGSVLARFAVFGRGFPQLRFLERRLAGVQSPPRTVRRLQTFGNEFRRNRAQPPAVRTLQGEFANFAFSRLRTVRFAGCPMPWHRFRGLPFRTCRVCAVRPDTGRILRHPPARTFFRRFGHPRHSRSRGSGRLN